jgi:hypothetical protein
MGSMFVGKVLMSMYDQPAKAVTNTDLEPIKPGAWAAWAKSYADEQAAAQVSSTPSTENRLTGSQAPRLATGVHHG